MRLVLEGPENVAGPFGNKVPHVLALTVIAWPVAKNASCPAVLLYVAGTEPVRLAEHTPVHVRVQLMFVSFVGVTPETVRPVAVRTAEFVQATVNAPTPDNVQLLKFCWTLLDMMTEPPASLAVKVEVLQS
ncbi:MAG TPA: hypothetical protein VI318_12555 [Baekduia sp.]